VVRYADPDNDAAACAAIYAPHVEGGVASFETVAPDAGEMRTRIRHAGSRHPWLVCERDGEITGYAYASPHHERAAYRWAVDIAVYVGEEHQRRGVGRELYGALLGRLEEQGLRMACAGIALPNPGSVALHESMGFVPVGIYRDIGWKAGAWHDVGWWQRGLGDASRPPAEPLPLAELRRRSG
jgi:phosphinothricin acetyltransferase